jgi:signal transduction histidine kinase
LGLFWLGFKRPRGITLDDRALIQRLAALLNELAAYLSAAKGDDPAAGRWLAALSELAPKLPPLEERFERLDLLETEFHQAVETAKLDAMKEFAYGLSHEINNPLANISARAQTLLQDEKDPERRRRLAAINTQAFRAHEMIADMMLFARPPRMARQSVNLIALADALIDGLSEDAAAQHTQLARKGTAEPLLARVDPIHLRVALRALVMNSLEAVSDGGRIEVEVRRGPSDGSRSTSAAGATAEILVCDDGPGIPPQVRPHIFDPFYSGREAGRGLGLGLSKCWRIITEHGGRIAVDSAAVQGVTFKITLPLEATD